MARRVTTQILLLIVASLATGCALLSDEPEVEVGRGDADRTSEMSVALTCDFVLQGLDELPPGVHLTELHLGVGSLFFEPVDENDSGIAYTNRSPFPLHFDIADDSIRDQAPTMLLPEGGTYQISMQLAPQPLASFGNPSVMGSQPDQGEDTSLMLSGYVVRTDREEKEPSAVNEPAPLPWRPTPNEQGDAKDEQKSIDWDVIPFHYESERSVRFILGQVHVDSGASVALQMEIPVGIWVEEQLYPAIDEALGNRDGSDRLPDDVTGSADIDLTRLLGGLEDSLDSLIGGIQVVVR